MIASVLEEKYSVLKTAGNFNNEIGLPLTLFRVKDYHDVAVVEMGISDYSSASDNAHAAPGKSQSSSSTFPHLLPPLQEPGSSCVSSIPGRLS